VQSGGGGGRHRRGKRNAGDEKRGKKRRPSQNAQFRNKGGGRTILLGGREEARGAVNGRKKKILSAQVHVGKHKTLKGRNSKGGLCKNPKLRGIHGGGGHGRSGAEIAKKSAPFARE